MIPDLIIDGREFFLDLGKDFLSGVTHLERVSRDDLRSTILERTRRGVVVVSTIQDDEFEQSVCEKLGIFDRIIDWKSVPEIAKSGRTRHQKVRMYIAQPGRNGGVRYFVASVHSVVNANK